MFHLNMSASIGAILTPSRGFDSISVYSYSVVSYDRGAYAAFLHFGCIYARDPFLSGGHVETL
jgi:hypothetical protein